MEPNPIQPAGSGRLDARQGRGYTNALRPGAHALPPLRAHMSIPNLQSDEWEQLCRLAPCGLLLLDNNSAIRFLNTAGGRLLGVDPDAVRGKQLSDAMPAWKDTTLYASLPSFIGAQSTFESIDFDVPGPDQKQLRVYAAYVPNGTEKARGVLLSVVESTEVATLEQRLHRA